MGSLVAAQQQAALTREQYLADKRSNISNKTDEGRRERELIFDEYERYKEWKRKEGKYDIHDAVIRLQSDDPKQLFCSGKQAIRRDLSILSTRPA